MFLRHNSKKIQSSTFSSVSVKIFSSARSRNLTGLSITRSRKFYQRTFTKLTPSSSSTAVSLILIPLSTWRISSISHKSVDWSQIIFSAQALSKSVGPKLFWVPITSKRVVRRDSIAMNSLKLLSVYQPFSQRLVMPRVNRITTR